MLALGYQFSPAGEDGLNAAADGVVVGGRSDQKYSNVGSVDGNVVVF
jgi:hypothetical protein